MAKIIIPRRKIGTFKSFIKNVVKKNPRVAKALNQGRERKQFYGELEKYKAGGITKQEMRKVAGKFWYGGDDHITKKEAHDVASQYIKSGKRYIAPEKESIVKANNQHGRKFYSGRYSSQNGKGSDNSLNGGTANSRNRNNKSEDKKHENVYDALHDIKHTKP